MPPLFQLLSTYVWFWMLTRGIQTHQSINLWTFFSLGGQILYSAIHPPTPLLKWNHILETQIRSEFLHPHTQPQKLLGSLDSNRLWSFAQNLDLWAVDFLAWHQAWCSGSILMDKVVWTRVGNVVGFQKVKVTWIVLLYGVTIITSSWSVEPIGTQSSHAMDCLSWFFYLWHFRILT